MTPIGLYEAPFESQQIDQQLAIQRATNLFQNTTQAQQASYLHQQQLDMQNYAADAFKAGTQQVDSIAPVVSQHVTDMLDQQNQAEQGQALQAYGGMQLMAGMQNVNQQLAQQQQPTNDMTANTTDSNAPETFMPPAMPTQDQQPSDTQASATDNNGQPVPADDYQGQARAAAQQAGINPDLFVRQIQAESNFNPQAQSSAGAQGIAQFMPDTAKSLGVDTTDPVSSLQGAAKLMASYGATNDPATWTQALQSYNAGPNGNPNNPETAGYVSRILGNGDSSPQDPGVATAASAAISAGAKPSDIAYAERNLDADAFKGLCEQFVETAETGHGGIAASATARWDQQADNRVEGTLKGIQVGDEVHFSDPNDPNGHVGIYDGNNTFISATSGGVKKYDINQWEKMTGQSLQGYIPVAGSAPDMFSRSSDSNAKPSGLLGGVGSALNSAASDIGGAASSLGSYFAGLKTPAVDAIHNLLMGTPFDQNAVEQANQERQSSQFGLPTSQSLGNIAGSLGNPLQLGVNVASGLQAAGYSSDPIADMVSSGMNPINPLDWSRYLGTRLLDTATQAATGGGQQTFASSSLGKLPVLGGLIEGTLGDPLQLAAMVGTGGIEGAAGAAARAAAFGLPSLSAASENQGATPGSTAAAGALGAAGSIVPDVGKSIFSALKPGNELSDAVIQNGRQELQQLTNTDPQQLTAALADQTKQPPEAVAKDLATGLLSTVADNSNTTTNADHPDVQNLVTAMFTPDNTTVSAMPIKPTEDTSAITNTLTEPPVDATDKAQNLTNAISQDPDIHANLKDIMTDPDLKPEEKISAMRSMIGCQ